MSRHKKYTTEWHRLDAVERWRRSGLSQAAFCRQEGISENSLSNWKQKALGKSVDKAKGKETPSRRRKSASVEVAAASEQAALPPLPVAFVPLVPERKPSNGKETGPAAEITFAGFCLRVFPGVDVDTLRALLQVMKEAGTC